MNHQRIRAEVICVLRYREYLRYATMAHAEGPLGAMRRYYELTAREYRFRARDAAYIATGEFAATPLYTDPVSA